MCHFLPRIAIVEFGLRQNQCEGGNGEAEAAAGWWFCAPALILCSVSQLKAVFQQAVSAQVMTFFPEILLGCMAVWCRVSRWKEAECSSCHFLIGLAVFLKGLKVCTSVALSVLVFIC